MSEIQTIAIVILQVVFSLPAAALLYFPCKAIASPHKKG